MGKQKLKPFSAEVLNSLGVPNGPIIGIAVVAARALSADGEQNEVILARIAQVAQTPAQYADDAVLGDLAAALVEHAAACPVPAEALDLVAKPYQTWGAEGIDAAARAQMDAAMSLPVTVAGALMPDAHLGYGLPIGGVLATEGCVIPYAVGVDIACRMRLTVFEQSPIMLSQQKDKFEKALRNNTRFGSGVEWKPPQDDDVLDDPDWQALPQLRSLRHKAEKQLGTSGSGNHFVEWGELNSAGRWCAWRVAGWQISGVALAQRQPGRRVCNRKHLQQNRARDASGAGSARRRFGESGLAATDQRARPGVLAGDEPGRQVCGRKSPRDSRAGGEGRWCGAG